MTDDEHEWVGKLIQALEDIMTMLAQANPGPAVFGMDEAAAHERVRAATLALREARQRWLPSPS